MIQKWERRYPDQYQKWLEDERISFTIPIGAYANRTCPLCRKSLEDYPQNKTQYAIWPQQPLQMQITQPTFLLNHN